jgi:hypothetical protein
MKKRLPSNYIAPLLTLAVLFIAAGTSASATEIHCKDEGEDSADNNSTPFYDKKLKNDSITNQLLSLDKTVDASNDKPVFEKYVPQGLAAWKDYYGPGKDLLVFTAHSEGDETSNRAVVQGLDPRTGELTRRVEIGFGHAGGIAIWRDWMYVSGGDNTVRRYNLDNLRSHFKGEATDAMEGTEIRNISAASFMDIADGVLYAGRFDPDNRNYMYKYAISPADGSLTPITTGDSTRIPLSIMVPQKTQGLLVLPNYYVFSTSEGRHNRSNIYVVKRGYQDLEELDLSKGKDSRDLQCFRAPTMSEGLTLSNDKIYLLFESGASHFGEDKKNKDGEPDQPDKRIKSLHFFDRVDLLLLK